YFLHTVGGKSVGLDGDLAKTIGGYFSEYPVLVMQTHDRGGGNHNAVGQRARAKCSDPEHARAQPAVRIWQHDAHFGGTSVRVEDVRDIGNPAFEYSIRKSIQADLGGVPDVHCAQVILKDVAHDPDLRQVGNGEKVGSVVETLDSFCTSNILFD